jgi:signal transduction histidine kinase
MQSHRRALAAETSGLAAKGIAVEVDLQPMPPLMLDGDKMKQAISILCKNAEEAMLGGGRLTISDRVCEQEKVIVVKVTDTESGVLDRAQEQPSRSY